MIMIHFQITVIWLHDACVSCHQTDAMLRAVPKFMHWLMERPLWVTVATEPQTPTMKKLYAGSIWWSVSITTLDLELELGGKNTSCGTSFVTQWQEEKYPLFLIRFKV